MYILCFRKHKSNPLENARASAKLQKVTEEAVHLLSTLKTASVFIESLTDGVDFAASVSQARFESLIAHLLANFALPIENVLKKVNLENSNIKKVWIWSFSTILFIYLYYYQNKISGKTNLFVCLLVYK